MTRRIKRANRGGQSELFDAEAAPAAGNVLKTQKDVARFFQVSLRTVGNWIAEGMPLAANGYYDTLAITPWLQQRGYGPYKGKKSAHGPTSAASRAPAGGAPFSGEGPPAGAPRGDIDWQNEYRKVKTALATIELKMKQGQLLRKEDVEIGRVRRIQTIKQALLSFPGHVAPQLAGLEAPQIADILDQRVREIIESFAGTQGRSDERPKD